MIVDTVIDLDNNKHYLLLDETMIEDKKYFFAVGVKEDLSSPTNEYVFIEEITKNGKLYAKEVKDKKISDFLLTIFTKNYVEYVEKIEAGEEEF
ncbi:MAG: hypothetical protein IJO32_06140 [Bacilli bacterium]|nr:hypothetical protein [Bacilli bacterium]